MSAAIRHFDDAMIMRRLSCEDLGERGFIFLFHFNVASIHFGRYSNSCMTFLVGMLPWYSGVAVTSLNVVEYRNI